MAAVLKTEGLTKHFGRLKAVEDVDLEVQEGDIYGFLGLNGAGKSTTIRLVLRLMRPTAGLVTIFGRDTRTDFIEIMRQVGALVELPAYYPYLTAFKNLEILRRVAGDVPRFRIEEILETVGLRDRMHDRVGTYSQGMRQRLGIAMALLTRPRFVILDEPTNGLDPHGINHIRGVIQRLNREEGVTFLISSHLLHEVEITCTRVGIIKAGRLVLQDTMAGVLARTVSGLSVRCDPVPRALEVLGAQAWVRQAKEDGPGGVLVECDPSQFAQVNAALHQAGVAVSELTPQRQTLEEFFLSQ